MPFPVTFAAECESCKKLTSLHKKGNYQLTKNRSTCNFFTRRAFETQRLANVQFLTVLPENCVKSRLEEVNFWPWKSNWKVNAYSCSELSSMNFKHSSSDASNLFTMNFIMANLTHHSPMSHFDTPWTIRIWWFTVNWVLRHSQFFMILLALNRLFDFAVLPKILGIPYDLEKVWFHFC